MYNLWALSPLAKKSTFIIAKEEFVLAFSPNGKQSTSDETIEGLGYELYDNADLKIVSTICSDMKTGYIF